MKIIYLISKWGKYFNKEFETCHFFGNGVVGAVYFKFVSMIMYHLNDIGLDVFIAVRVYVFLHKQSAELKKRGMIV